MPRMPFRQVHLDFHTSEQIPGIGSRFDGERFAETLKRASVNSITCFSRCHHGWIYHDTRFSEVRHPHLTCNLLAEQIKACHAAGIRVPIYITVGWDELQSRQHPEWLQRTVDGKPYGAAPLEPGWHKLCLNSPYVDFVQAQTEEVLETLHAPSGVGCRARRAPPDPALLYRDPRHKSCDKLGTCWFWNTN